jgi:hypothetical protein
VKCPTGRLQRGNLCLYGGLAVTRLRGPEWTGRKKTRGVGKSAAELQSAGGAKIDAFIDYFRKTGDYISRVSDLDDAERQLRASVEGFRDRDDLANAALSLIGVSSLWRTAVRKFPSPRGLPVSAKTKIKKRVQ